MTKKKSQAKPMNCCAP